MLFWILCAVLTVLVTVMVLRPVIASTAQQGIDGDGKSADLTVYRDQLAEVERDHGRGLLSDAEAEAARLEVSRRIIAAGRAASADGADAAATDVSRHLTYYGAAAVIVFTALGLYITNGSPGYEGRPHAERAKGPVKGAPVVELVARVEARLREHPDDGQGWDVLGPVYLRQRRFDDAATAFRRAISLLGESQARLGGLAEALLSKTNGIVSEDVRRIYEKMIAKQPELFVPRFWLAVRKEQDGDNDGARKAYEALLRRDNLPPQIVGMVRERYAAVGGTPPAPKAAQAGGSGGKMPAPSIDPRSVPQDQRAAMIEQMVSGLATRLAEQGGSLEEWQRLIRAYTVLGRRDRAITALGDARRNLEKNPEALSKLDVFAKSMGLIAG